MDIVGDSLNHVQILYYDLNVSTVFRSDSSKSSCSDLTSHASSFPSDASSATGSVSGGGSCEDEEEEEEIDLSLETWAFTSGPNLFFMFSDA